MPQPTCAYVHQPNHLDETTGKFTPAIYCGQLTEWHTAEDECGDKYRKYDAFCKEHDAYNHGETEEKFL